MGAGSECDKTDKTTVMAQLAVEWSKITIDYWEVDGQ